MGGGKGDPVTIGYKYYLSMHMGISRGPIDELVQINVGDIRAWPTPDGDSETVSGLALIAEGPNGTGVAQYEDGTYATVSAGTINTVRANASTSINAPRLFGGDKKEGGISGSLQVLMGAASQVVSSGIKSLMGGRVPDFRGVATLFYDGLVCAMNPYPKRWSFRVRRTVSGWDGNVWQPTLATIWLRGGTIKAMNPAHIIYECLTNRDWGRGFPRSAIDETGFLKVAQTLFDEGFGLCMRWNRQDELAQFVQQVIDHMGGSLYQDRTTGLITVALLRGDYDVDALPTFTYDSGLLAIEDDQTAVRDDVVNEVIINWYDTIKNEDRQKRVHNLASIQSLGAVNSSTAEYDGLPVEELAARVGQRDLRANTTSLKRYTVTLDRRAWRIIPGAVFKISAPDKNIFSVVLRAGKVKDGSAENGKIVVDAVLDVFGLPSATFVADEPGEWSPPDRSAVVPARRMVREATYADLVRRMTADEIAALDPSSGTIATIAGKPTPLTMNYTVASRVGAADFVRRNTATFAPYMLADEAVAVHETEIAFTGGVDLGLLVVGGAVQMGDEICRIDDIDTADGSSGIITLARGCMDTIPQEHTTGTVMFAIDGNLGTDLQEYVAGDNVDVKMLSITSTQELSLAVAPIDTANISARWARPYPPGRVRVNGVRFSETGVISGDMTFTWTHRDKTLIQDQLLEHEAASVGPETDTTYTVLVFASAGAPSPARTVSGLTGTSWVYTTTMMAADAIGSTPVFEIWAVRYVNSKFKYRFPVQRS